MVNSKVEVKRSDFPKDFIFGASTSAYQIEGAWNADGKGKSIWDNFAVHTPKTIADGSNGCIAIDHYNRFKEDVALLKKVGLDAYRFSISWSRILPAGKLCGGVSKEGIKYYNDLIDALLAEGIDQLWATLFHWDLPQCLEDEYDGFLDKRIVGDFCDFADVCFWEFGDRVKNWTTLNEPWSYTYMGYVTGLFPPGRGGFFKPIIEQAMKDAERAREAAKNDAAKDIDSNRSQDLSKAANDDEDWLPFFDKIINDAYTGDPETLLTTLLMRNQQLNERSPIGACLPYEPFLHSEEDSDSTDEEDDSDTDDEEEEEQFLDAMTNNFVGYTLLQRDLEKKQPDDRSSLPRYLGIDKLNRAATATATARTEQPSDAQKPSQLTLMKRKAIPLEGDPGTEPYTVAHNLILAHAHAVKIYRTKYKKHQRGQIGITNVARWFFPHKDTPEDAQAVSRALDFLLGWFVAPLVTGDYPPSMRNIVRGRLPKFTPDEVTLVKGSYDFMGINYYTSSYAKSVPRANCSIEHYANDLRVKYETKAKRGEQEHVIGQLAFAPWLYVVPEGIYHLMLYMKERYNNPVIYITENGVCEKSVKTDSISKVCNDETRIDYHRDHLAYLKKATEDGVRLKGYFIWSLLDNFEWHYGYTARFGVFYIDFNNGRLTRFPKNSAKWWMSFMNKPMLSWKALTNKPQTLKNLLTHEKTEEDGQQDAPKKEMVKN